MLLRQSATRPLVVTSLLLLLTVLAYLHLGNGSARWTSKSATWLSDLRNNTTEALPSVPAPATNAHPESPSSIVIPTGIASDAHKLLTADDFVQHFQTVTQIKGLTMAEAKSTCTWEASENVNFQYSIDTEWAKQDRNDTELESRRNDWHHFIKNELLPYEKYKDRFEGRGIVIVAGNEKSLKRVKVILEQLKRLGSQLPIELNFWGDELTPEAQKTMSSMWPKMYYNDLSAPTNIIKSNNDNRYHINYHLKTAAILNSRFAEPLLLDSDNIPVVDPESLYETDVYKEFGTLFWPDIARSRQNNPMWAITNTPCRMDEYEQESGQVIIDKRKFFYHLQLAAWFNNVHGIYYNEFLLGDKDLFRFAWHALKTKYGHPAKWLTSIGTLAPDGYYCGHSFAQHHPNGSVAFIHGGLLKTIPKEVMKWQRDSHGGIFQAYKRSVVDERHNLIERVEIKIDGITYMPNRPEGMKAQWCTDMKDISPRKFEEIVPGFQKTFDEIGGYWIINEELEGI